MIRLIKIHKQNMSMNKFKSELIKRLEKRGNEIGKTIVELVSEYPAPVGDSKYQRTNHLHDAWYSYCKWDGTDIVLHIGVDPKKAQDKYGRQYAMYVVGYQQTDFHQAHGWPNVPKFMESPALNRLMWKDYQSAIDELCGEYSK